MLSRARLTLLKANLTGMPNHIFSCLKCPNTLATKIEGLHRKFFWGNDSSPPIAWSDICTPIHKDGLGIRPILHFNKAALAKLGWKIITQPDNLWVKVVSAK